MLDEFWSMSVALPGLRNLFGCLQHALSCRQNKHRISLKRGVHQALDDFQRLVEELDSQPTRLAEVIPLGPVADGHHDVSGTGACGIWWPHNHLALRNGVVLGILCSGALNGPGGLGTGS